MGDRVEVKNARIEYTRITRNHGCLTAWVCLDYGGSGQGFGGWVLDGPWDSATKERRANANAGLFVARVMDVVGVESWEELAGKSCRVRASHTKVEAIGHYLRNVWFVPHAELEAADDA